MSKASSYLLLGNECSRRTDPARTKSAADRVH